MGSIVRRIIENKLEQAPPWLLPNLQYEVIMGSNAYAVSSDMSDTDIVGFCIPSKEDIFPHLRGEFVDFGTHLPRFKNWQRHHIQDPDMQREYDVDIYGIIHYFDLCMDNNPNLVDSLFVPERCVIYMTAVGKLVRDNRKMFLHKGAFHRFKGYAWRQMQNCQNKKPEGKRVALVEKYGFDVKFAYHIVRLMAEVEQILTEGDLDLERNREHLKAIRNGECTLDEIIVWFKQKEKDLQTVYDESTVIPYKPDEPKIRQLLMTCLEHHYGSLDKVLVNPGRAEQLMFDIDAVMARYRT